MMIVLCIMGSPGGSAVKNLLTSAGDVDSIPESLKRQSGSDTGEKRALPVQALELLAAPSLRC